MTNAAQTVMIHGCAVALGRRAIIIEGDSGSGKTTLALELIDRGAMLIADDQIVLEFHSNLATGIDVPAPRLLASPAPNIEGLIEVRNVGICTLPYAQRIPAALVLRLDPAAPRFIDAPQPREWLGITLPMVLLTPHVAGLPLRAEYALEKYGL